jgi:hypothetical protein
VVNISQDNPIWDICDVAFQKTPSFESGQLVIDKERCWKALELTLYMNAHSDSFYDHLYGDKDTFFIAWLMLDQVYGITPHRPKMINFTLCQRDMDGNVIFQHRNSSKWILSGQNHKVEGFELESECLQYVSELRDLWNGEIFHPPLQSAVALAAEIQLCAEGLHEFKTMSVGTADIEFLSANRVGRGRNSDRKLWCVVDGEAGLELQLFGDRGLTSALQPTEAGRWSGEEVFGEKASVELRPLDLKVATTAANARSDEGQAPEATEKPDSGSAKSCPPDVITDLLAQFLEGPQTPGDRAAMSQTLRMLAHTYCDVPSLLKDAVASSHSGNRAISLLLEPLFSDGAGGLAASQSLRAGHSSTSVKAHLNQYKYDFEKK